jgi:hypothetical protein
MFGRKKKALEGSVARAGCRRFLIFPILLFLLATSSVLLWFTAGESVKRQAAARQEAVDAIAHLRADIITPNQADSVLRQLESSAQKKETRGRFFEVLRDLGIALLITVILAGTVEIYARVRFKDEILTGAVEAAFKPLSVFDQVRRKIIGSEVIKRDWIVSMNLTPDATMVHSARCEYFASHTIVSYKLSNTSDAMVLYPLRINLDKDLVCKGSDGKVVPCVNSVHIDGDPMKAKDFQDCISNEGLTFEKDLRLHRGQTMQIAVDLSEVVRVPDTFAWSTNAVTESAGFDIETSGSPEVVCFVEALHPEKGQLIQAAPGRWRFMTGLLPWQGFEIRTAFKGTTPREANACAVTDSAAPVTAEKPSEPPQH